MLDYQLLTPEEDPEQIFPYRRVWRALISEMLVTGVIVTLVLGLTAFDLASNEHHLISQLALSLLPVAAFFWFSVRSEQKVFEPRSNLIPIFVLTIILANGFVVPLVEQVITPDEWLPGEGFFNRIFGYTLTLGALTAFIQYAVVRYTVWPDGFRMRLDGVAYCMAAAVGFATVDNVRYVLLQDPIMSAAATRILTNLYLNIMVGVVIGYFLGEMVFGNPFFIWFPMGLAVAAFVYGLFMAFRGIAVRSGLNIGATSNRPIGPYFLIIGFATFTLWAIYFLIESADERMASREGVERVR